MGLPLLNIHINGVIQHMTLCVCLTSFIQCNVFEVHSLCHMNQSFIHFYGWIFYCKDGPHFVYVFIWSVSTFWRLWIVLLWTFVYTNLCKCGFSPFGYIYKSGIAGSCVTLCLTFWGTSDCRHGGCSILCLPPLPEAPRALWSQVTQSLCRFPRTSWGSSVLTMLVTWCWRQRVMGRPWNGWVWRLAGNRLSVDISV